jgi:small conductance mechanosensitive channel
MEKWLEQMGVGPQLFDTLVSYGSRIVGVIVILFISLMIARWLKRLVARRLEQIEFDRTLGGFLANMTYWLVVVVAVISCMGIFGVETTSFAAVLGGLSVAVGLALKGTLSNVAAGAMLLIFRPFNV